MTSALGTQAEGRLLEWSGALLVGGLVLNAAVTMLFHPAGNEDVHPEIFAEYAASDSWEWVHFGQLVGVLLALGGLIVLHQALRSRAPRLSLLAAGATVATAAVWTVLQAVDGVALKQAVDAWVAAEGPDESLRFADAETVRWTEWGLQSYMRVLLGVSLLLFGAAILASHFLPAWTGWSGIVAGVLSIAIGIDVSYSGLDSGFEQIASPAFQVVTLVFAIGVAVTAARGHLRAPTAD